MYYSCRDVLVCFSLSIPAALGQVPLALDYYIFFFTVSPARSADQSQASLMCMVAIRHNLDSAVVKILEINFVIETRLRE